MVVETTHALPQTCHPTAWLWPGQLLYAGPALDLAPHSGSVWCLAVGIDRPLRLRVAALEIVAGSVLIPPRTVHHLLSQGRMVSCYLDPTSLRAESARRRFTARRGELAYHHRDGDLLVTQSWSLFAAGRDEDAAHWLDLAAPWSHRGIDPRIAEAALRIRADPAVTIPSGELAAAVGLSESRFLHLFRHETGTSLRRYRLWIRLMSACTTLAAGRDVTAAAMEAGFASPSHLADRIRSTFGLSATQLLATGLTLRTPDGPVGAATSRD